MILETGCYPENCQKCKKKRLSRAAVKLLVKNGSTSPGPLGVLIDRDPSSVENSPEAAVRL